MPQRQRGRPTQKSRCCREWPEEATAVIRRVVAARVTDPTTRDDLVQDTVLRLLERAPHLTGNELVSYAAVTARNVVISQARLDQRHRRNGHRLLDRSTPERPEERALRNEEIQALSTALSQMSQGDRDAVVAHEVFGVDTASLARTLEATPGAIAVRLARARAKLRLEYLIALVRETPPTVPCRRVLAALSHRDRARQAALDATGHLAQCDYCRRMTAALSDRRAP